MSSVKLWRTLLILAVVAVAGVLLLTRPFRLGLDLQGGTHVVLEAEPSPGIGTVDDQTMQRALAIVERRVNGLGIAEPIVQRQGQRRIIVELPGIDNPQQAIQTIGKTALLEFKSPTGETVLTGADLATASLSRDQFGRPAVAIEFKPEGARKFADLTTRYVGQVIPILLDGQPISTPVVRTPIPDGKAQIEGDFTVEEARHLVVQLNAGALPVPLKVAEVRTVGPTLGRESIDQSLRAGIVGAALVFLYMLLYYRLPGGIADLALAAYIIILLGAMVGLQATLTLPGIAGLVLSTGMGVDGNVLVLERIREALREGKRVRAAMDEGFKGSLRTILDGNVTVLIAAAALFYFGTGPIRGFGVTLTLGIVASMFTQIVLTRLLLSIYIDRDPERAARQLLPGGAGVSQ
ncbi:protein translocase subunit SecD [Carboxydochorda subterranea]|uniref:Protein translocase subunit SecD n=1 Tax=Carboxydichorda subterranea TaxID=3109565 RepID=A0ABZ1C1V5_9FIRM|nr:protein translocase subunit SecD [Limnochorda sp. L945t]WRP18292.1 protein translocase subunit SecD [Limnochorda sp. L945t]